MLVVQLQRADESGFRSSERKCRGPPRKATCPRIGLPQARPLMVWLTTAWKMEADKVLLCGALVDQGLDICLCKHAAAGGNGIKSFIIFRVFIQAGGIRLKKGSHLVDKGTRTSGTDTVHTLFDISAFKIDDLGVLTAQLDGYVRLGSAVLQGCGYGDYLLDKGNSRCLARVRPPEPVITG